MSWFARICLLLTFLLVGINLLPRMNVDSSTAEFPIDVGGFQRAWDRTDQPVAEGRASRTWIWGEPISPLLYETYAGSPDGRRAVQYFDKARMELTHPDAVDDGLWYVTTGLLVVELVTGRMQVGDSAYIEYPPAQINIAGDADDPRAPTYATLNAIVLAPPAEVGSLLTKRLDRAGIVSDDPSLLVHAVTAAQYVPQTNHTIASPFWAFMTSSGVVQTDGQPTDGPLFINPFYATGYPITESYWTTVTVGGTPKDVLLQCFERRCLTYTPDNPPGWQVEAGNVGQHYYQWRYPPTEAAIS